MTTTTEKRSSIHTIVLIWLAWCVLMLSFQAFVTARGPFEWLENIFFQTTFGMFMSETEGEIYLSEPFLNQHVSWDSEYYLSIATAGYPDLAVDSVQVTIDQDLPGPTVSTRVAIGDAISLNYAFFPVYPLMMRILSAPLRLFGLNQIAAATLAGVIISMLGALAGMIALYDLTKDNLGEKGGIRTAFYLLIFPTGMFLAQVYTEGLFIGLAFSALAMTKRKHWYIAAVLAMCATMTRAVGVALFIPLIIPWIQNGHWMDLDLEWRELYFSGIPWRAIGRALVHFSPLIVFLIWRLSFYGFAFGIVEELFFGRGALRLGESFSGWLEAARAIFGENRQVQAYYLIEFGGIILGFWSYRATRKQYPELSWYSLVVMLLALTSGVPLGMHRYIIAAPSVFIALSYWGRSPIFDRAWTVVSLLLMGLLTTLFSFNFWVG